MCESSLAEKLAKRPLCFTFGMFNFVVSVLMVSFCCVNRARAVLWIFPSKAWTCPRLLANQATLRARCTISMPSPTTWAASAGVCICRLFFAVEAAAAVVVVVVVYVVVDVVLCCCYVVLVEVVVVLVHIFVYVVLVEVVVVVVDDRYLPLNVCVAVSNLSLIH